jgi:hypothetical protein
MEPISVIVAALAAGAAVGVKDTVSRAVEDAYGGLRELVRRRLARRRGAVTTLVEYEASPQMWQKSLADELVAVDAGSDEEIVAAAQRVLALVDPAGTGEGKYRVDTRKAQGVQVGDYNTQSNKFITPPAG